MYRCTTNLIAQKQSGRCPRPALDARNLRGAAPQRSSVALSIGDVGHASSFSQERASTRISARFLGSPANAAVATWRPRFVLAIRIATETSVETLGDWRESETREKCASASVRRRALDPRPSSLLRGKYSMLPSGVARSCGHHAALGAEQTVASPGITPITASPWPLNGFARCATARSIAARRVWVITFERINHA